MNTLAQEKAEVARLRGLFEKETNPEIKMCIGYKLAYARLEHDIVECGVLEPERIEQVKNQVYKRVKYAVIAISIAVILAIVLFANFSCTVARETLHLVGAVGEDAAWIANKAADNIQTEK